MGPLGSAMSAHTRPHKKKKELGLLVVAVAVLTFSECGGGGTSSPPSPSPPSTPILKSIAVAPANSSIVVAANVQFTAMGTLSDGSTKNLTTYATWNSSATNVATVNSEGVAAGGAPGTTTITATSGAISGSTSLAVSAVAGTTTITATLGGVSGSTSLTVTPSPPPQPPSHP